jgi:hypothetical protein
MSSVIPHMKSLLEETESTSLTEWEDALGNLLGFCEETGIELEAEGDLDEVLAEIDGWLADSDLTEDEKAQLDEFAKAIKKLAFKGARAAGKVAHAWKSAKAKVNRAKAKVKAFAGGVKRSARAGYAAGHKTKPGGPKRRTVKRPPGAAKKPMKKPMKRPVRRPGQKPRRK